MKFRTDFCLALRACTWHIFLNTNETVTPYRNKASLGDEANTHLMKSLIAGAHLNLRNEGRDRLIALAGHRRVAAERRQFFGVVEDALSALLFLYRCAIGVTRHPHQNFSTVKSSL